MEKIISAVKNYLNRLNTGHRSSYYVRDPENIPEQFEVKKNKPVIINIILFIITIFTTSLAGGRSDSTLFEALIIGLPYSITILSILLSHEFGHYFAAKKFGVKATLPYFIPFFPVEGPNGNYFGFGTMGAVIKIKSPIPNKRALFYIGVMGPILGFIVSLIAVVAGVYLSEIKPLPIHIIGTDFETTIFGNSLLFAFIVEQIHGTIPPGFYLLHSAFAKAGWIGFLITSLNLMPLGQLDGGHILYALIGRKQVIVGWAAFIGLIILSFIWYGWIVWIVMTLFVLMIAHPYIPNGEELSIKEKIIGWCCMLILLLTFIPIPVEFI